MIRFCDFRNMLTASQYRLAYERAKAPSISSALTSFICAHADLTARIKRIGLKNHLKLTALEIKCADAGLGYPTSNRLAPVWRLPDNFIAIETTELPAHPLIEPLFLSTLSAHHSTSAYDALQELLSPNGLERRWHGVPRIGTAQPHRQDSKIAISLHLFYPELWPALKKHLDTIPEPYDIFISVPEFACTSALAKIAAEHPSITFIPCQNRGRDIMPFLHMLKLGVFDRYDAVCKIHSKRSPHRSNGNQWLEQLLSSLLGGSESVAHILEQFRGNTKLGLLGPADAVIRRGEPLHRGCNQKLLTSVAQRASLPDSALDAPFFSGTMFWFRAAALTELRRLSFDKKSFPIEMAQTDGTLAHAIERVIWPLVTTSGYEVKTV